MNENHCEDRDRLEKLVDRLWEWVLHEDSLFIARGNFFLVAEAMLFTAFAAVVVDPSVKPLLVFVFGIVGAVCSAVWIYLSWAQVNLTMKPLRTRLKELFPDYTEVISRRRRFPALDWVLGILFPLFLLIVWLVLLLAKLLSAV
jgi:hypothetical protein